MIMKRKLVYLLFVIFLGVGSFELYSQDVVYIHDYNPWSYTNINDALDSVFGTGNWTDMNYANATANIADVLSTYSLIYLNGADDDNSNGNIQLFMTNFRTDLEDWVSAGGKLIFHFAGYDNNYAIGFGDVSAIPYYSNYATTVKADHPIFTEGTYQPCDATNWTGNSFSHHGFSGSQLISIIEDELNNPDIAELDYGGGVVMFCGYTDPNFMQPSPNSQNLVQNIMEYAYKYTNVQWTGLVDSNWFEPLNWSDSLVPVPGKMVLIPEIPKGNANNFPVISGNTAYCGTVVIANGATLTINTGDSLIIDKAFANKGTNSTGDGELVLKGDKACTVSGIVNNLLAWSSVSVTASNLTILNRLDLGTTPFRVAGTLTLNNHIVGDQSLFEINKNASLNVKTTEFTMPSVIREIRNLELGAAGTFMLQNDLYVEGDLLLTNGNLSIGANELTLNGLYMAENGTLIGSSESSLIMGEKGYNAPVYTLFKAAVSKTINNLLPSNETAKIKPGTKATSHSGKVNTATLAAKTAMVKMPAKKLIIETVLPSLILNNLAIKRSDIVALAGNLDIWGNLEILRGELNTSDYDVSIKGDLLNESIYSQNNGKLSFSGNIPSMLDCGDSVVESVGPSELSGYDYYDYGGVYFDAYTDFTLNSVKIWAEYDGSATVTLYNSNDDVLFTVDRYFLGGIDTIEMNVNIPAGSDYYLYFDGYDNDFYYDYDGADSYYPMPLGDFGAITGNDWDDDYYYPFFFDWQCKVNKIGNSDFNNMVVNKEGTFVQLDNDITINTSMGIQNGTVALTDSANTHVNYNTDATLTYLGAAPQVLDTIVYPLTNGPKTLAIKNTTGVSLDLDRTISGVLDLQGLLILGNKNLTLDTAAVIDGTPDVTAMVVANSNGKLSKLINQTGTYLFPVGDNTGTKEYSPVSVKINSAGLADASIAVNLKNAKHPENTSTSNFINRYWSISQSGISGLDADVELTYVPGDVVGKEIYMTGARWSGTAWDTLDFVNESRIAANVDTLTEYTGISIPYRNVSFEAVDEAQAAVENVSVNIDGDTKTTNASGEVEFSLPIGFKFGYTAELDCYKNVADTVDVLKSMVTKQIVMELVPQTVTFTVKNGATAISGATVTIGSDHVVTNASGVAEFSLVNGNYNYSVTATGFVNGSGSVTVDCEAVSKNVALSPIIIGIGNTLESNIKIYPNPSENLLNIVYAETGLYKVTLLDLTGNTILSIDNNTGSTTIDMTQCTSGIYIIRIECEKGILNQLITKE